MGHKQDILGSSAVLTNYSPCRKHVLRRHNQDITLYDYEIRDVDAWEDQGTPLRVTVDVTETLGTGPHSPTVSISGSDREGLSFAALGLGDGLEDSSTAFVADLDDANKAISALTIHTTADDGAVSASGVLSLGACDSGEWATIEASSVGADATAGGARAAWWDWRNGCREGGWAGLNVTFGYRMGTMPVLESVWPAFAPVAGGLTVEVGVLTEVYGLLGEGRRRVTRTTSVVR